MLKILTKSSSLVTPLSTILYFYNPNFKCLRKPKHLLLPTVTFFYYSTDCLYTSPFCLKPKIRSIQLCRFFDTCSHSNASRCFFMKSSAFAHLDNERMLKFIKRNMLISSKQYNHRCHHKH